MDVPLSPRGERQAAAAAPFVADWKPDVIVSSAMRRAVQTAAPIVAACGVEHVIEADLHERYVGALGGKTNPETGGLWTQTLQRWQAGDLAYAPEGAESFLTVQTRVVTVLQRLLKLHDGRRLAIVAHGHVNRVLLVSVLPGLGIVNWEEIGPIANASFSELLVEGGIWRAERLNELPDAVRRVNEAD